ncbi:TIGR03088 family PEP-CTERM/XrtA system glycosyltransferase [Undibacterium sp.]|jgi:sugar transferase (PEP-CTERM/EpsH1 system associated)|uniref:TIGR03088 family PEP-CTERM/XrtA system glycosyltransferase n=1 Tax=Undibacterium sp. TaxID=1914977 RepID=UPI002CCE76EA|nr:TIGR03088 family PEP-CTERM/XrtA system glycosyltransferase [Undibacterium sp.]HTD05568.1 TIGR03088 family PEP-CTERM/XrtA system glycosyltransferase [Undibacterium sp.]
MSRLPPHQLPLVVHLVYRLDFGGLETVLAECVNRMPADKYRHAIVCLTDYTAFSQKITKPDVPIYALHKPAGLGLGTHLKLWKLLRKLAPTILHTYNLAAIEYAFTAAMAGVPVRIHAEHGRDLGDPQGKNPKHNMLRRLLIPFIDCYVPVSRDLKQWLKDVIRVPDAKNLLINNGVDTGHFHPAPAEADTRQFVVGTVGRIQDIKNHKGLVIAFQRLLQLMPEHKDRLRLQIVGDGPLMQQLKEQVAAAGLNGQVWLPGARSDIADLMRAFSVFVLPSFAEGTPVTLLEAMSCGLPVIASAVGGIPDVVSDRHTGVLVAATDHEAIAAQLAAYCREPALMAEHGMAGRSLVEQNYSIAAMLLNYTKLYDTLCRAKL